MFARVAKWEGGEADAMRKAAQEVESDVSSGGMPEGVPATAFLLLIDPDNGRQIGISLFESEENLRKGDEVLNSMNPPEEGIGQRSPVETYEVAVNFRQ